MNGKGAFQPLLFPFNSFQQVTTQSGNNISYIIDGNTSLTISTLIASSTINMYLYPSVTQDQTAALAGANTMTNYSSPGNNGVPMIGNK